MTNFPYKADLSFYQSRNTPKWASRIRRAPESRTSIDVVVNAHGGVRLLSVECAALNLASLCGGSRRITAEFLEAIAKNPQCAISPKRRAGFAAKWAKKLREQELTLDDLVESMSLKDRYSGQRIHLGFRGGKVVSAMGCEPARYIGLTVAEAEHKARYSQK